MAEKKLAKKMFLLSFICDAITSNGFTKQDYTKDSSIWFKLTNQNAFLYSTQNLYQNLHVYTDVNTNVDTKGPSVTHALKIEHGNSTIQPNQVATISYWVVDSSLCPSAVFVSSPVMTTYTVNINEDEKVCVFPVDLPANSPITPTIPSGQTVTPYTCSSTSISPGSALTSGTQITYSDGLFFIVSGKGETSFELGQEKEDEQGYCVSNSFKTLNTKSKIVSNPISWLSTGMKCNSDSALSSITIETGFPTVVIVLLVILIIFCIAAGVTSCACKDKQEGY